MRRRDFFAAAGGAFAATKALAADCVCDEQVAGQGQTQAVAPPATPSSPTPWQAGQHDRVLSKVRITNVKVFGVTYDEVSFPLAAQDVFVFCSDGVFEAMNRAGEEFGARRLLDVVRAARDGSAQEIAHAINVAVDEHRAGFPPNDDSTILVLRLTQ